jgi:hypothetical protein
MEALLLELVRQMPIHGVARLTGISGSALWRIINHDVDEAVKKIDCSSSIWGPAAWCSRRRSRTPDRRRLCALCWRALLARTAATLLTNGVMEGLNSLLQAAKRKARGYRLHKTFITMAYLIAGKLDLGIHRCSSGAH